MRISGIIGVLLAIGFTCPTLAAPSGLTTGAVAQRCSIADLANCPTALRGSEYDRIPTTINIAKSAQPQHEIGPIFAMVPIQTAAANHGRSSQHPFNASPGKSSELSGFVFHANEARHSARPALLICLGEIITKRELSRRFSRYEVRYTQGEGCLTCAVITGADEQLEVDFDQDGRTVINLRSTDDRGRDVKGNRVGSSLANALGSATAQCDAGESTTCSSPDLKGLHYIVIEDERCPLNVQEKQPTAIPACARIAGFQISSN